MHQNFNEQRIINTTNFISLLTHAIRNPLNTIKGAATLLDPKVSQDHDLKRLPKIIVDEVDRLDQLISEIANDLQSLAQEDLSMTRAGILPPKR